jgi:hypothetical protein
MVATEGLETDQVTEPVMSLVVAVALPICSVAMALNWAVWPTAVRTSTPEPGRMEMFCTLVQPARVAASGKASRSISRDAGRRVVIKFSSLQATEARWRRPCNFRGDGATFGLKTAILGWVVKTTRPSWSGCHDRPCERRRIQWLVCRGLEGQTDWA